MRPTGSASALLSGRQLCASALRSSRSWPPPWRMISAGRPDSEHLSSQRAARAGADDRARMVTSAGKHAEGLKTARLFMVVSSMSPLFLLWAIRGNSFVRDKYLLTFCVVMLVLPNLVLGLRIRAAIRANDRR